ncbi:MAG: hypothetical protein Q8R01_02025 [Ramlibacter sp.]|nr:hypothetical protein [Ramlibacter sp.]
MKTVAAFLIAALCAAQAIACDKVDAAKVQAALFEMGTQWSERDGGVLLEWGRAWDGTAASQRLGLLRAFAEGDVCLTGRAREISFYRHGKLVGRASPSGIQLLDTGAPGKSPAC